VWSSPSLEDACLLLFGGGFDGSLLFLFLLPGLGRGIDGGDDFCGNGGPEARAGVPAGACFETYGSADVVGAGGDVVESGCCLGGVDGGLDEACGFTVLLVGKRDEASP